jgi:type VI secretion system protein ImpF
MHREDLFHKSILNRLIDLDPLNNEPANHTSASFREVEDMVLADLEKLLNTRQSLVDIPASCPQAKKSLLTYGLSDFTAENPRSNTVQQSLCQEVTRKIALFEPRLRNVTVRIDPNSSHQGLNFKISATIDVAPFKEAVFFDTFLDPNKGHFTVKS